MELSIEIPVDPLEKKVDYHSHILFLGSCFASNVGERFRMRRFSTCVNPFGVLFNPFSVLDALERIVTKRYFTQEDFFLSDGRYLSLDLHSDHSYPDVQTALERVNGLVDRLHRDVSRLTHVFLTFGTAEVFRYRSTGRICANCHKIPQREFTKERMSVEQIVSMASRVVGALRAVNPDVTVVYTVSPVRYLSEGALGNSVSKGVLFCAAQELIREKNDVYMPVYEIITDQLRDYRFFDRDMVHPNALAVDFLWEKIAPAVFSSDAFGTMERIEALSRAAAHRPFHPQGEQYRRFCRTQLEQIRILETEWPQLDFADLRAVFDKRWDAVGVNVVKDV